MSKIIQLLLGRHQDSSLAGWAVLVWTVYQSLIESGYHDYKLLTIGVGLFFLLRFLNEKVPGLSGLVADVVQQLQAQARQGTIQPRPLNPGEVLQPAPIPRSFQLDEALRRLEKLESENAGLRAELAVNAQRTQEVQRNATTQIDLARRSDPLRTDL